MYSGTCFNAKIQVFRKLTYKFPICFSVDYKHTREFQWTYLKTLTEYNKYDQSPNLKWEWQVPRTHLDLSVKVNLSHYKCAIFAVHFPMDIADKCIIYDMFLLYYIIYASFEGTYFLITEVVLSSKNLQN